MIRPRFFLLVIFALLLIAPQAMAAPAPVLVLTIDGTIAPANADYAVRGITRAAREGAQLVVLEIDTPGGLDTSMRSITKAIIASSVPVATYVAPGGARAASAGTYILYASHIAAMAPGTNLGAATPVQLSAPNQSGDKRKGEEAQGSAMTHKQINDAAAYIRGFAQMRGRNAEWAEQAVREAVSLSADEALKRGVIEYVAADLPSLLEQLNGKKINVLGQEKLLQTANAPIENYLPDWRVKLLATVTDPSIALILMALGVYGLFFEFLNPGMVVPGVFGGISLLLGLYALQLLPVNYAGLALIMLGMSFMMAEAFMPSFGVLGLGGIASFVLGAVILINTDLPGFGIPLGLIMTVALLSALLIIAMASVAWKARHRPAVIGEGELTGKIAEVIKSMPDGAWVYVHGENWRALCDTPLDKGQKVRVLGRNELVLRVAPVGNHDKGE